MSANPARVLARTEEQAERESMPVIESRRFPVVEIFGPTIQGEGPDVGRPCYFLRMGGCDYRCGWSRLLDANIGRAPDGLFVCDSLHAVLPGEVKANSRMLNAAEIVGELTELAGVFGPRYLVISGGNPAMHFLDVVVSRLQELGWTVAVETQGSLWKDWLAAVDRVVVSPKPPSSKQIFKLPRLAAFLDRLSKKRAVLKIPIYDDADLDFADDVFGAFPAFGRYLSVANDWRKPNTTDELLARYRWIIEAAQRRPFTAAAAVLPQLHVLTWGNEKER